MTPQLILESKLQHPGAGQSKFELAKLKESKFFFFFFFFLFYFIFFYFIFFFVKGGEIGGKVENLGRNFDQLY